MAEASTKLRKTQNSKQKLWELKNEKSVKNAIFDFYRQLFNKTNNQEDSVIKQKVIVAIESTIWTLQIISLLWVPNMQIYNWNNNMILWEIIGHWKLDNTCASFGIIDECFFIFIIFAYASFISVIIFVTFIYYSYRIPAQVFSVFNWIFYLWANIFLIPSIEIFTLFFKYNFKPQSKILEYDNGKQLSDFEVNFLWLFAILFALLIAFILFLLYSEYSAEIRHSTKETTLTAKAHSKIDTHIAVFTYIFPIAFVLFAENQIIYLHILAIIFSALLIKETITLLPYFSHFCNTIMTLRLSFIVLVSFLFIFGRLMDNSLVIWLLFIILGPISAVFVVQFSTKLQRTTCKDIPRDLSSINSQYELEKSLRNLLCSENADYKDEIIKIFENFYIEKRLNGDKLQAIWAANYCLFILKDESLAKIKLAKTKNISASSLEANFQEYLCNKNIEDSWASESSQFSNYFLQLYLIKKEDQELCIHLINFWNEITYFKPNLNKLKKSISKINLAISDLNAKYNQIFTRFPNSRESLALFVSYTRDITYEFEKSNLIEVKLRALERSLSNPLMDNNFSCFNDNNGIFIISNETDNFGEILYANQKTADIFNLPLKSIISDNFFNFIDSYYKDRVKEEAKRFIQLSSVSEMDLSQGFFLTVRNQYLVECTGKLWVTSINNLIVAILIFKQKLNNHQVALISENEEIISYSKNFAKVVRKSDDCLVGCQIKKLFFKSKNFDLKPFIPYHLKQISHELLLILSHYQIYNIKISYIIIISDSEEIFKWENSNKPQNDEGKLTVNNAKLSVNFAECDTFRTISSYHKENAQEEDLDSKVCLFTDEEFKNNSSDRHDDAKSQASITALQHKFLNMVNSSARSINILHIAFVFSVLTVLAVNIAVLAYAFADIKFISDINLPILIGKAGKNFQRIGLFAQILIIVPTLSVENSDLLLIASNEKYTIALSELETIYSSIISKSKNWNACSMQSILGDENIDLWSTEAWTMRREENLISTISMFIKSANEFKRKLGTSESPWDLFRFLLFNGWGVALDYCNKALVEIVDCQTSMMNDFRSQMIVLLMLGPAVLIVCILIILPFYFSIFKIENTLWNNARKNASKHYSELKQTILERLKEVHSKHENLFSDQKPSMEPYTFKSYWRYAWVTLVYLAAVVFFCLINMTYLYEKCSQYLTGRPEIIRDLMQTQILYTTAGVWTQQMSAETYGYGPWLQFPIALPFSHSTPILNSTILNIKNMNLKLRNPKFSPILSDNFKQLLYENNDEINSEYFALGVYPAQKLWIFDAYVDGYVAGNPSQFWVSFMDNLQHIDEFYSSAIDEIDKYSQDVINSQMTLITMSLISFIMCSFLAYFGFYLLFFRNEKKYMQKINNILKIMPSR